MQLKDAVKHILADQGKSQTWLAEQMGYSCRQIAHETISRNNVRLETLIRLCDCLGAEVAILYKDWEYTLEGEKK